MKQLSISSWTSNFIRIDSNNTDIIYIFKNKVYLRKIRSLSNYSIWDRNLESLKRTIFINIFDSYYQNYRI